MENKFIHIISPVALPVVLLFDAAIAYYTYIAVLKIMADKGIFASLFLALQVGAIIIAVLTTREVLRHGVLLTDSEIVFTALDFDNKVRYDEIERIEVVKDTKASLRKNFISRYSSLVFYLNDDTVLTVELGITTKRKLNQIESEINTRLFK